MAAQIAAEVAADNFSTGWAGAPAQAEMLMGILEGYNIVYPGDGIWGRQTPDTDWPLQAMVTALEARNGRGCCRQYAGFAL